MTDTPAATLSLFARLHAAQREIGGIKPDGENSFHKYKYVKAETLISEVGYMLRHHGLVLVASSFTVAPTGLTVQDKNGQVLPVIKCSRVLKLVCHETGETEHHEIDWFVSPDAGRPIDKACGVASTAALGYFLRDLLLIPRTDGDPNDDEWDRRREEAERKAAKPQSPPVDDDQRDEINGIVKSLKLPEREVKALSGGDWPRSYDEAEALLGKLRAKRDAAMDAAKNPPLVKQEPPPGPVEPLKPTVGEVLLGLKAELDLCEEPSQVEAVAIGFTAQIRALPKERQQVAAALCDARILRLRGIAPAKGSPMEAAEAVLSTMAAKVGVKA